MGFNCVFKGGRVGLGFEVDLVIVDQEKRKSC